jgi:predicted transcriptional regulator
VSLNIVHSTKFDAKTDELLRSLSKAMGIPISNIIREATKKHATQLKQQNIFLQEGQDSLEKMAISGQHLTETEVDNWLESWGTEKELDTPKCHV